MSEKSSLEEELCRAIVSRAIDTDFNPVYDVLESLSLSLSPPPLSLSFSLFADVTILKATGQEE